MARGLVFLLLLNILFSQQISVSDLNKISNNQLEQIRKELEIQNQPKETLIEDQSALNPIKIQPNLEKFNEEQEYFGYEYFKQEINFFDNIPTPLDFRLGPGDEILLSLWGETNQRKTYTLDKNGMVFFENIGFINLSNQTLNEAEVLLIEELSKIYSTLKGKDNSTKLNLDLGKITSINVYFTGEVIKPGINLIHPFSDVFSALVQAGGVNTSGSLRQVTLIRNNKIIEIIDFYSFFTTGLGEFQKNRIIDGDIIHIPPVKNRIQLLGEINKPKYYEALQNDTLNDLIEYAGGLKSSSSNKALIENISPLNKRLSDDNAKSGTLVNLASSNNLTLSDGSKVTFLPVANNDYSVEVFGRVTLPGRYPVYNSTSSSNNQVILKNINLKELLDLAGGFEDPVFRKSINNEISILRLDENQFYSKEFKVSYDEAENFSLEVNDKIFVYENSDYSNNFMYTIKGEINFPGSYPINHDITLGDAISLAGGLTELGSKDNILVFTNIETYDREGNISQLVEPIRNLDLDYQIKDKSIIHILAKTNLIQIEGNVYSPGLITYNNKMSISQAIDLVGGVKPNTLFKKSYVQRANGKIELIKRKGRFQKALPGDRITVTADPEPKDFDLTAFIADFSSTLANLAAIMIIIDKN